MAQGIRVLLVEDNLNLATLQAQMLKLQPENYQVQIAYTGQQAKAALQDSLPDIILLDLTLPAPDGLSILRWMQTQKKPMPPVIVTTSCTEESVQWEALRLGAKYFMIKPYHLDDLLGNIRMLLRKPANGFFESGIHPEKVEYLHRVKMLLNQMTSQVESEGYRYVLMAMDNYFDHGRQGISIKALSEKAGQPINNTGGNNLIEAAIYRLVYQIWRKNSPAYQQLCSFCGLPSGSRMPVRRFLSALAQVAQREHTLPKER